MAIENFLIPIFIILALLIIAVVFLSFNILKLKKRLALFFKKGDTNLEEVLTSQLKKVEKQEEDLTKIFEKISQLDKISQKSFQKIGIVRFNPFREVGGNQSFSIALLNADDNGFILSSYYGHELNRIYAKPVSSGRARYSLSKEEKKAIEKAINHRSAA